MAELNIQHEPGKRYYAVVDGGVAEASYKEAADGTRSFDHTFVPDAMRGKGVAEQLVRHALDDTIRSGHKFIAICPYVKHFVQKHPEYKEAGHHGA
jgi:predicted GNAT family acetyltransferase